MSPISEPLETAPNGPCGSKTVFSRDHQTLRKKILYFYHEYHGLVNDSGRFGILLKIRKHTGPWVEHQGSIGGNETTGEAGLPLLFCSVGLVDSQSEFYRFECVFHQHGDGHGANTARNRRNITCNLFGSIKIDIST